MNKIADRLKIAFLNYYFPRDVIKTTFDLTTDTQGVRWRQKRADGIAVGNPIKVIDPSYQPDLSTYAEGTEERRIAYASGRSLVGAPV